VHGQRKAQTIRGAGRKKFSVNTCLFVVTKTKDHERNASREPAHAVELSRGVANRVAGFLPIYRLANSACVTAGDFALRAGLASCNGPEPHCGLVTEASRPALCRRDPPSVRAGSCGHDDYRFRATATGVTNEVYLTP